jgi:hypothetical protein
VRERVRQYHDAVQAGSARRNQRSVDVIAEAHLERHRLDSQVSGLRPKFFKLDVFGAVRRIPEHSEPREPPRRVPQDLQALPGELDV